MRTASSPDLRTRIKAVLPPVLARTASRLLSTDPRSIRRVTSRTVVLRSGRVLHHRGTEADRMVLRQQFDERDYDLRPLTRAFELYERYESMAAPIIIDCGANIGASSVWFSTSFPKARVVAIEPDRANYELLERNTDGLPRVSALNAAIGDRSGAVVIRDPGIGEWGYRTQRSDDSAAATVPVVTIDEILESTPGEPFILKVDIEGAEEELFGDNAETLARFPLVIIELHDWMLPGRLTSRNFLKWHVEAGRDFVYRRENVFSIANDPQHVETRLEGSF